MATVFEIVDKLRAGEEVVVPAKYAGTVMQQIEIHGKEIGDMPPIDFKIKNRKCTMRLERR